MEGTSFWRFASLIQYPRELLNLKCLFIFMSIKIIWFNIIKYALLCGVSFFYLNLNIIHADSLWKEKIFAIDGVKKKFKTFQNSVITTDINEYNFIKDIKSYICLPGNYVIDSYNATINYHFNEMTPLSIHEVASQLFASFDMHAKSADICTAIYVKNFEINFIIDSDIFLNIKSDRCEIIPNKKIQFFKNIKSNNSALNNRNFFVLDQHGFDLLLKRSYRQYKQLNSK